MEDEDEDYELKFPPEYHEDQSKTVVDEIIGNDGKI